MRVSQLRSRHKEGFSLIESLLALVLSLGLVLAGVELFGIARKALFKLEAFQTGQESAAAALEKIKADLQRAGRGLPRATETSDEGIAIMDNTLTVKWNDSPASAPQVEVVLYYLDSEKSVLRRKAGSGIAQPLLEGVAAFACAYDLATNIMEVEIRLEVEPEKFYAIKVFPRNMALAKDRG